ncbi:prolyl-tRNA synthetase [Paenibacillus sp. FSL R7-0273]|uniref:prolyl-tRNA synthetase associated domain-containing protein n=1 Tax=Paenibacillus sp. FSL R7-0273 TaxID=1536772 RepID=UPI0004F705AF|nr:prolyl-tRNA synthetase associated domain-containing protein [Paenibacillus sp. FSL R7-0273]AIQ45776.1 prolyl-tRNA synthetase [Paenibacillus sp. FSL R7-0273]OMF95300.1 prolyl-tRNA editing protein [Paenibacillus sp. FSL R7-0273]
MMNREAVIELLKQQNVSHEVIDHPAAYTIADMESFGLPRIDQIAKNLFIRDDKKRNYYLLTIQKDKSVNLKQLRTLLESRPLTFASEEDLLQLLGLTKGAVSPFGILNDKECTVKFILDEELHKSATVGVHPNENTATVWLAPEDLLGIVTAHGNEVSVITL